MDLRLSSRLVDWNFVCCTPALDAELDEDVGLGDEHGVHQNLAGDRTNASVLLEPLIPPVMNDQLSAANEGSAIRELNPARNEALKEHLEVTVQ